MQHDSHAHGAAPHAATPVSAASAPAAPSVSGAYPAQGGGFQHPYMHTASALPPHAYRHPLATDPPLGAMSSPPHTPANAPAHLYPPTVASTPVSDPSAASASRAEPARAASSSSSTPGPAAAAARGVDSSTTPLTVTKRGVTYTMVIRQNPEKARMCGYGERSDRRPIDPPPIIQVKVDDPNAPTSTAYLHNPFLFMHATLIPPENAPSRATADAASPARSSTGSGELPTPREPGTANSVSDAPDSAPVEAPEPAPARARAESPSVAAQHSRITSGCVVSSLFRLRDVDGSEGGFFVFPDISVRTEGTYRLRFTLLELANGRTRRIASLVSSPFVIYAPKKFPGLDESTPLSKLFAAQGLKVRTRRAVPAAPAATPTANTGPHPITSAPLGESGGRKAKRRRSGPQDRIPLRATPLLHSAGSAPLEHPLRVVTTHPTPPLYHQQPSYSTIANPVASHTPPMSSAASASHAVFPGHHAAVSGSATPAMAYAHPPPQHQQQQYHHQQQSSQHHHYILAPPSSSAMYAASAPAQQQQQQQQTHVYIQPNQTPAQIVYQTYPAHQQQQPQQNQHHGYHAAPEQRPVYTGYMPHEQPQHPPPASSSSSSGASNFAAIRPSHTTAVLGYSYPAIRPAFGPDAQGRDHPYQQQQQQAQQQQQQPTMLTMSANGMYHLQPGTTAATYAFSGPTANGIVIGSQQPQVQQVQSQQQPQQYSYQHQQPMQQQQQVRHSTPVNFVRAASVAQQQQQQQQQQQHNGSFTSSMVTHQSSPAPSQQHHYQQQPQHLVTVHSTGPLPLHHLPSDRATDSSTPPHFLTTASAPAASANAAYVHQQLTGSSNRLAPAHTEIGASKLLPSVLPPASNLLGVGSGYPGASPKLGRDGVVDGNGNGNGAAGSGLISASLLAHMAAMRDVSSSQQQQQQQQQQQNASPQFAHTSPVVGSHNTGNSMGAAQNGTAGVPLHFLTGPSSSSSSASGNNSLFVLPLPGSRRVGSTTTPNRAISLTGLTSPAAGTAPSMPMSMAPADSAAYHGGGGFTVSPRAGAGAGTDPMSMSIHRLLN
ncbi:hypothetical protein H9P43_004588 [Blastocladiella emersonii ATCC 22665]|nr:hypothetical protein H9P43_004588 [Blastocladiella emersonii ATCC 22665]